MICLRGLVVAQGLPIGAVTQTLERRQIDAVADKPNRAVA